jgi:acyl-CoA synthetase (NDP forming)
VNLDRLLYPRSIAVVGASESTPNAGLVAMLERGLDVYPVNPRRDTVFGYRAYPSLSAIGRPVDAVLSLLDAERSVDVVAEAVVADAGSVVVVAGGFAPGGPLETALREAAGDGLPLLGPNCNGLANVHTGTVLSAAPSLSPIPGGIGLVTQSGGYLGPLANGGRARGIGFSHLISTGNEIVTDVVDYLEALVADPQTRVVALVLESVRRPDEFFAAVGQARLAGKPVVALKLGTSGQAQDLARTHTGAVAGDPLIYDGAFRQHGIIPARDAADLLDRVALFELLPHERWSAVTGLAVLSTSGGMAALASDVCEQEGIELPTLADLEPDVARLVAQASAAEVVPVHANPADLTGFMGTRPDLLEAALERYVATPEVDALLFVWLLDEGGGDWASAVIDPLAEMAAATSKPLVLASLEDGEVAAWAQTYRDRLAIGRGLRGTVRGLHALGEHMRRRGARGLEPASPEVPRPAAGHVVTELGPALPFAAAMDLLTAAGIPVAPFAVLGPREDVACEFAGPFVAKLADVAHRTELGAVRVGVEKSELARTVEQLRTLAGTLGVAASVVVQPRLPFDGEAFLGVQTDTGLGPAVLCGVGGTLVEVLGQVVARIAPFDVEEAATMLAELDPRITHGLRGARPWDLRQLAELAASLSRLATASRTWLRSLDVNPLVHGPDGFVAVDALCIIRD